MLALITLFDIHRRFAKIGSLALAIGSNSVTEACREQDRTLGLCVIEL